MTRVFAAALVLSALLATAPVGAESVCIQQNNCYGIPGPVGGGFTGEDFSGTLRLFGSQVLAKTGVIFVSKVPVLEPGSGERDTRVYWCVNGACGGVYGYTYFTDQFGQRINVYVDGRCTVFADHHGWLPQPCHTET